MEVTHEHACRTSKSTITSRRGGGGAGLQRARPPLTEALVLALCVPAAGSLALLMLRFGAELVPVGLAVLVDQSNLRWEGRGGRGRPSVAILGLFVLFVWRRESQDDVSVQDAQRHASHGVLEVVLRGEAVIEACVGLVEGLQEDPVVRLQDAPGAVELRDENRRDQNTTASANL